MTSCRRQSLRLTPQIGFDQVWVSGPSWSDIELHHFGGVAKPHPKYAVLFFSDRNDTQGSLYQRSGDGYRLDERAGLFDDCGFVALCAARRRFSQ